MKIVQAMRYLDEICKMCVNDVLEFTHFKLSTKLPNKKWELWANNCSRTYLDIWFDLKAYGRWDLGSAESMLWVLSKNNSWDNGRQFGICKNFAVRRANFVWL